MEDIELGHVINSEDWAAKIFQLVDKSREKIDELSRKLPVIEKLHAKILSAISDSDQKDLHRKLDVATQECRNLASVIRNNLKKLEVMGSKHLEAGSADARLLSSQQRGLASKFREIVLSLQKVQQQYQDQQRIRFQRQYRIVNPDATTKQMNELLDENYSGPIFAQSVLNSAMMEEAKSVLNQVRSRHDEIIRLSKSITELQSLFDELSDLITSQDDTVNQVSHQMSGIRAYTGTANQELYRAVKSARTARRRRWCLASLCIILLTVATLVIIFVIVPMIKDSSSGN